MKRILPSTLHPRLGGPALSRLPFFVPLLLLAGGAWIVVIFYVPGLAELSELSVYIVAGIGIAVASFRLAFRRRQVETAMKRAAKDDALWHPERLEAAVIALFEPYWQALAQLNPGAVANEVSPFWRDAMEQSTAEWRRRSWKPMLTELRLQKVSAVGAENCRNGSCDQAVALVECFTSFHLVNVRTGELVDGDVAQVQKQLWRFIRGDGRWLLNRVEIVESGSPLVHCRVFEEPSG